MMLMAKRVFFLVTEAVKHFILVAFSLALFILLCLNENILNKKSRLNSLTLISLNSLFKLKISVTKHLISVFQILIEEMFECSLKNVFR